MWITRWIKWKTFARGQANRKKPRWKTDVFVDNYVEKVENFCSPAKNRQHYVNSCGKLFAQKKKGTRQ